MTAAKAAPSDQTQSEFRITRGGWRLACNPRCYKLTKIQMVQLPYFSKQQVSVFLPTYTNQCVLHTVSMTNEEVTLT